MGEPELPLEALGQPSTSLALPGTQLRSLSPCQHLVTFCLGEEDGVHTVEDASRKLSVMDSQGRVWAQEMLLRVSPGHVTLLDPVSKVPGSTWVEGEIGLRSKGESWFPSTENFGKLPFEASAIKQGVISRLLNSFGCLAPSPGHRSSGR